MQPPDAASAPRTRRRDKLEPRPGGAWCDPRCRIDNVARSWEFEDSNVAAVLDTRQLEHPRVLPAFRLQGRNWSLRSFWRARAPEKWRLQPPNVSCRNGDRSGSGVDRRAARLGVRRQHPIRFTARLSLEAQSQTFALPQSDSARVRGDASSRSVKRLARGRAAQVVSPTSIPVVDAQFDPRRGVGGHRPANGGAARATATISANAYLRFCLRGLGVEGRSDRARFASEN